MKKLTSSVPFVGTMYPMHSTKFSKIGFMYHPETGNILQVEFSNGALYQYSPVTREKYSEIFSEKEKGKWLSKNFTNNSEVSYVKVGTNKLEL